MLSASQGLDCSITQHIASNDNNAHGTSQEKRLKNRSLERWYGSCVNPLAARR